jgi:hypothetical protein
MRFAADEERRKLASSTWGNEINTAMALNRFLTCGIVVF